MSLLQTPFLLSLLPPTVKAWLLPHQLMTAFPCEDTHCGKGGTELETRSFFFFFLSSFLHQPSLGRSQQMSECDFSWDYWIIGQVCFRPHFMQDWGAFIITYIYISVFFLPFFFLLKKTQLYPCIIDIRKVYSLFWNMYLHPYKHLYNQDNADNEHINYPMVFLCPLIIPCSSPSLPAHSTLIYL